MKDESSAFYVLIVFIGKLVLRGMKLLFITPKTKRDKNTFEVVKKRQNQNFWEVE